jgi:hypothetical protein
VFVPEYARHEVKRPQPCAARESYKTLRSQTKYELLAARFAAHWRINGCVFFTQHLAEIGQKGL